MNENVRMGTVNARAELQEVLDSAMQAGSQYPTNEAQITGRDRTFNDRDVEDLQDAMADASDDCEVERGGEPEYGGDVAMAEDSGINKIRDFSVKELNYGFLIKVGCHSFAISTAAEAGKMITEYLKDPKGTEKKWYDNELALKRQR